MTVVEFPTRLRETPGPSSPDEARPIGRLPEPDYLAVLGDWPTMEDLARRHRERELAAHVRTWRSRVLADPSLENAAQFRKATFDWLAQIDRIVLANEGARGGWDRPGA